MKTLKVKWAIGPYLKVIAIAIILSSSFFTSNAQMLDGRISMKQIRSIFPELNGKLEQKEGLTIEYYSNSFYPEINGKLKSVNDVKIEYYTGDFYPEIKRKLKSIGDAKITYYTGNFQPELKGKLRSIDGKLPRNLMRFFPELDIY